VKRSAILGKTLRRIVRARSLNPMRWYIAASANFHCFLWSSAESSRPRTFLAGTDTLDPQYFERPDDLAASDRARYFDPVRLTDDQGAAEEWLERYIPADAPASSRVRVVRSQAVAQLSQP
jgi:hypothetical protein